MCNASYGFVEFEQMACVVLDLDDKNILIRSLSQLIAPFAVMVAASLFQDFTHCHSQLHPLCQSQVHPLCQSQLHPLCQSPLRQVSIATSACVPITTSSVNRTKKVTINRGTSVGLKLLIVYFHLLIYMLQLLL